MRDAGGDFAACGSRTVGRFTAGHRQRSRKDQDLSVERTVRISMTANWQRRSRLARPFRALSQFIGTFTLDCWLRRRKINLLLYSPQPFAGGQTGFINCLQEDFPCTAGIFECVVWLVLDPKFRCDVGKAVSRARKFRPCPPHNPGGIKPLPLALREGVFFTGPRQGDAIEGSMTNDNVSPDQRSDLR